MKVLQKTVINISHSIGINNLTIQQSTILGQNAELFILEILQSATALSISSKRNRLMSVDINNALVSYHNLPLLGYKHQKKQKTFIIPYSAEENLLVLQEKKIDLESLSISEPMPYELMPHYDIKYLVCDERDMLFFSPDEENEGEGDSNGNEQSQKKEESEDRDSELSLSRLQNYFQKTIEYVKIDNNRFDVILSHVKTDIGVGKLLRRYIDFFENFLQTEQNNYNKMVKVLKLMTAVCINREYRIEEFIDEILSFAFTFFTTHEIDESTSFEQKIEFKQHASGLIVAICDHCDSILPDLRAQVGQTIEKIEKESFVKNDFYTFYGCLILYLDLGKDILRMNFLNRISEVHREILSMEYQTNIDNSFLFEIFCNNISITLKHDYELQESVQKTFSFDEDELQKRVISSPLTYISPEQRNFILSNVPSKVYLFCESYFPLYQTKDDKDAEFI